jgi:hypothetical protein
MSMLVEMTTSRNAEAIPRAGFRAPKSRDIIKQNANRLADILSVCTEAPSSLKQLGFSATGPAVLRQVTAR